MDFSQARRNMVECQLRTNRVTNPAILAALNSVPRERFVPKAQRGRAYIDDNIAIGKDRWMMAPMPLARLIQEAAPARGNNVLVIGAGFGYAAALLGQLCQSVFAVEEDHDLVAGMGSILTDLAIDNVVCIEASLADGYAAEGPYDIILIAGAVEEIPVGLSDQLVDGGRLLTIRLDSHEIGRAMLYGKRHGTMSGRVLFDASAKPLPGFQRSAEFVF